MNDEIFRKYDIRGVAEKELTGEVVRDIGRAFGSRLREKTGGGASVCVGWDVRYSSQRLVRNLTEGLTDTGHDVGKIGMVPTPVTYFTGVTEDFGGAIQVTGSHNPPEYNGLKMMMGEETLFGDEIQELKTRIINRDFDLEGSGESFSFSEAKEGYLEWVDEDITLGNRQLKIALDAGNGAASELAPELIEERLGIETDTLFCEPDGEFPNHHPDPTVESNLEDLVHHVRTEDCDLGVAYDGDGDRIGVVSESGDIIWGDQLMIILSRAVLKEFPGATIIGEVKCSQKLFDAIEQAGGKPVMGRVGHSLIKKKLKESGAKLAGEMSGHIFFNDRFFGFDDALYTTCRLLEILSQTDKTISGLLADIPKTYSTPELREPCDEKLKFEIPPLVAEKFERDFEVNTIDGARINFDSGWGLVRASNTQPVLVLRVEADTPEEKKRYLEQIREAVEEAKERLL